MKVKLIGVQTVDFTPEGGTPIQGKKLHCIDLDPQNDNIQGQTVKTIFISASAAYQPVYEIGKTYIAFSEPGSKALAYFVEQK